MLSPTIWKNLPADIDSHTSIRFLKLGYENTLGKVEPPKAHHRTLKLNPALLLQWQALQLLSPRCHFFLCSERAQSKKTHCDGSAQRQGCASASCFIQH